MIAKSYAFVCLHGSAKSVIASEYLNRRARERGIDARAAAFGQEPDAEIPAHVIEAMARKGFDLRGRVPQAVSADVLARADMVVSFGCDLVPMLRGRPAAGWDACPAVSEGFEAAWEFITGEVDRLLEPSRVAAER